MHNKCLPEGDEKQALFG